MLKLQRLLVTTDFSKFSDHALSYACAIAQQFGAELHLLHVLEDLGGLLPEPGVFVPASSEDVAALKETTLKELEKLPPAELAKDLAVVREVRQGSAFVEIVRYAREKDIDLIVIATHGRTGLAHVLLGSVAERVVRKAPCPVLTVRHPEHEFVMP